MSLVAILDAAQPREISGSLTAARYDYQSNVAILKLIELHQTGSDFRMLFDFHDDIVILNSATTPTEIRLLQVKSKDNGSWKITAICKKSGQQPPTSYASRMYAHMDVFGEAVSETGFVTNASFSFKLSDGTITSSAADDVLGTELSAIETSKLEAAIVADGVGPDMPPWLQRLAFRRLSLGLQQQRPQVVGHLQLLLESCGATTDVKTSAVYDSLHAAITAKSTCAVENLNFHDVCSRKSITKDELVRLLEQAVSRRRGVLQEWQIIASDLQAAGHLSIQQVRIRTSATLYVSRRSQGDRCATQTSERLADWFACNLTSTSTAGTLVELANLAMNDVSWDDSMTKEDRLAASLVEAYEAISEVD